MLKSLVRRTVFIVVRYSVNNNGLQTQNRFSFQGNFVKINRILESIYNLFHPFFISFQSVGITSAESVQTDCSTPLIIGVHGALLKHSDNFIIKRRVFA
jgi:hypothetical protein